MVIIPKVISEIGANMMARLHKGQRHWVMAEANNIVMNSPKKDLYLVFKLYYIDLAGNSYQYF